MSATAADDYSFVEDDITYSTAYAEYAIRFIEGYCVHTIGEKAGEPLLLDEWQKEFIREALLMFWDGKRWRFVYQTILLGVPRGAGKSTLMAALMLFKLSPAGGERSPRVLLSANTAENVEHVYGPARAMIEMNPALRDYMETTRNKIICRENRGELKRLAGDGKGQFGHIPSCVGRDELHTWTSEKQIQLSEALQTALAKRANSQSFATTTAGYDKDSILGRMYDAAMANELLEKPRPGFYLLRDRDSKYLFWWYEAPDDMDPTDPATWRAAHPASWIDEDAIKAQLNDPSISIDEFRRQWLNQWTAAAESWLQAGVWQGLSHAEIDIPYGERICCAVDAAHTRDTTALAWAWQEKPDRPVVVRVKVWAADQNAMMDGITFVPGGRMRMELVEEELEHLNELYRVMEVAYDPHYFEGSATRLSDSGFRVMEFLQGSPQMYDAANEFYVGANDGTLAHDGDPVLKAHVEATAAVSTERGWKLFKLKQTKKIDACIAVVMAQARARFDCVQRNRSFIQ